MASIAGDVIAFLNLIAGAVLKQAESCRGRAASVAVRGWSSPRAWSPAGWFGGMGHFEESGIQEDGGWSQMLPVPPGAGTCLSIL